MKRRTSKEREEMAEARKQSEKEKALAEWIPKTELGRMVKEEKILSLDEIFTKKIPILESEIVDTLTSMEDMLVDTQKTTRVVRAGRKFSFRVTVIVGNRNGYIGIGTAKDKEKWPAVKKAAKNAKLKLVQVKRGSGSWEDTTKIEHSIPFKVTGKNASVRVTLLPAPRGVGLVAADSIKDVLKLAGIKNVWVKTSGHTRTKLNFVRATVDALGKTTTILTDENFEEMKKVKS